MYSGELSLEEVSFLRGMYERKRDEEEEVERQQRMREDEVRRQELLLVLMPWRWDWLGFFVRIFCCICTTFPSLSFLRCGVETTPRLRTYFSQKPRRKMSLKDTVLLSPTQKWKKYGIVPWMIILHVLLFFVVTAHVCSLTRSLSLSLTLRQVLLIYIETGEYSRANEKTFETIFLGIKEDQLEVEYYTIREVLDSLRNTVQTVLGSP